jgi:hypothetical protein
MLSLKSKHVHHVKIYIACNFKVNLIYEKANGRTPSDGSTFGPGELKNDQKRAITPRRVIRFTGHVDLDKLNMFSVYT